MGLTETENSPLLPQLSDQRAGTVWTAVAHIITAVIGSGVLSLAWSMSQLGWIAGPVSMLLFAFLTFATSFFISSCYRYPDSEYGPVRNGSYVEAVRMNLGEGHVWVCGLLVQLNFYGVGIAYVITSAICMRAIQKSNCYHKYGHNAPCEFGNTLYMLIFGVVQVFASQIPDFHSIKWLSVVAAIMSFTYASIGFGLGAAKAIGDGDWKGSIYGNSTSTGTEKLWLISQAIGDIAFAFPFTMITLEIQDTLRSPPPEAKTMKRAAMISISIITFFYLSCGGFGYAAFGDQTPGNLLTGFGFYEPYWLVDFANACIVLHLVGGYQVYSQPLFAAADKWFSSRFPHNVMINRNYTVKPPFLPALRFNLQRLFFRTAYVASTVVIAMLFPYFNEVLALLGALNFWPTNIFFPVEMYMRQKKIGAWTGKWIGLRSFSIACFFLAMFALVGSIQGLLDARFS